MFVRAVELTTYYNTVSVADSDLGAHILLMGPLNLCSASLSSYLGRYISL